MEDIQSNNKNSPLRQFTMELSDKLSNIKVNIDEMKGVATVLGKIEGKYLSIVIEEKDFDDIESKVEPVKVVRKSSYKEEVKRLHEAGFKQREIAFRLNMSQTLVSKLLNSN